MQQSHFWVCVSQICKELDKGGWLLLAHSPLGGVKPHEGLGRHRRAEGVGQMAEALWI